MATQDPPQKQHDFGLSSRSGDDSSRIPSQLTAHGIEINIITVLGSVKDLFVMEHSAQHSYCSMQSSVSIHSFPLPGMGNPCREGEERKVLIKYLQWDLDSSTSTHSEIDHPALWAFPLANFQGTMERALPPLQPSGT